jgi:type III pantothenate kinase
MPRSAAAASSRRAKSRKASRSESRGRRPRRLGADETLITVDVGNSDTVVGRFHGDAAQGFWRLTSGRRTSDEIVLELEAMLGARRKAEAAVLCSVVPLLTVSWSQALERRTGRPPLEVTAASAASLPIRYHDKTAVGADRIANAIAVRALYGTPAIVVDLGTATTFDCVSRQGAYLGGIIAPGVGTSAEGLYQRAARIPRVEMRRPERALGRTTEESIRAGLIWGHAATVDALVRRLALEMSGTPHVIATGGYAGIVAPECETINRVDESLTLKGMKLLWEESR